jgi:hypothetical protein
MVKATPFAVSTLSIPAAKYAVFSAGKISFAFNAGNMANPAAMAKGFQTKFLLDKLGLSGLNNPLFLHVQQSQQVILHLLLFQSKLYLK